MWLKNKKKKSSKSPEPVTNSAVSESKKRISEALRKFYKASLEPLRKYQARMAEIKAEYDADLLPHRSRVDAAKAVLDQRDKELRRLQDQAAPEITAVYNQVHSKAYADYKHQTDPHRLLRDQAQQMSYGLFQELVQGEIAERDNLSEVNLALYALSYGISSKAETLGSAESTRDVANRLIQDIFIESLVDHEEVRKQTIEPSQTAYNQAVAVATRDARQKYSEAQDGVEKAETDLEVMRQWFYKKSLASRVKARQDCEVLLQPLREELEIVLKTEFSALND